MEWKVGVLIRIDIHRKTIKGEEIAYSEMVICVTAMSSQFLTGRPSQTRRSSTGVPRGRVLSPPETLFYSDVML